MSRRMLSRVFGLLVLAGLCIGAVVSGTSAAPAPAACPTVSCLTETGYYQCVGVAGCTCDPRNDWCVAISQPTPTPACPAVSCGGLARGNGNRTLGNGGRAHGNDNRTLGNGGRSSGNGDRTLGNGGHTRGNGGRTHGNGDRTRRNGGRSLWNCGHTRGNDDRSSGNGDGSRGSGRATELPCLSTAHRKYCDA